jgi:hypothetical protein
LFDILILYKLEPFSGELGVNSSILVVVQLQVPSTFGSMSIKQGNLSHLSKLVNGTIGTLKKA